MWRPPQTKHVLMVIAAILAIAVLAVAIAYDKLGEGDRGPFWEQVAGAGMQVIVAATIGVAATLLLDSARSQQETKQKLKERQSERQRQESDYRLGLLRQLRAAYSDIKRVRRQFERAGFTSGASGPLNEQSAAIYCEGMETILRVKYELEAFADELQAGMRTGSSSDQIKKQLRTMEKYLKDHLIDEYLYHSLIPTINPGSLTFAQFPKTQAFVGSARAVFAPHLSGPYHRALHMLGEENQKVASEPEETQVAKTTSRWDAELRSLRDLVQKVGGPYLGLPREVSKFSSWFLGERKRG